jgi:phage terminase large subunit
MMTAIRVKVPHNFHLRPYQKNLVRAFEGGCKRLITVWHRRCGKDLTDFSALMVPEACERVGYYMYTFPTSTLGRRALWDGMDNNGIRFLDRIPPELIVNKNKQEMKIELINGSIIQIVGIDKIENVGINPVGVVFSEYSLQDPRGWDFMRPILRVNNGWAKFNFTPRGRNHAYELFEMAKGNPDWFAELLTVEDTGIVTKEQLDQERREGISEELLFQEYFCSFNRGIEGSYYGRLIDSARKDGRIGFVPFERGLEVHCAFDLGMDDATAIWMWQRVGQEIRFVDYYEASGEPLSHYVEILKGKGYLLGDIWVPHDAEVRELGTGVSRIETMRRLGLKPIIVPRLSLMDGIEAVRQLLPRCWFAEDKCRRGVECLEGYHKAYNDKMECYSERPVHDKNSHSADSMRYAAAAMSRGNVKGGDFSAMNESLRARL